MTTTPFRRISTAAAIFALGLSAPVALAEVRSVDQAVYGMDCAPCAYGVEKGLKNLKGVKEVTVSLNEGKAVVHLNKDNEVTISQIRDVIRNGGFTPKAAQIELAGKLSHAGGTPHLMTAAGTRYTLASGDKADKAWAKLQKLAEGTEVVIKGEVPEKQPTQVKVRDVSDAGAKQAG